MTNWRFDYSGNQRGGYQNNNSNWKRENKMQIEVDQDESGFNVNKRFAESYDRRQRSVESRKIKVRYGEKTDSSSEEDEEGTRLPEEFDKEFLRTLSCLKGKDPRIYDETKFFENLDVKNVKDHHVKAVKKNKPIFVRDHERELLLANNGLPDEEDANEKLKKELLKQGKTYAEEQQELKESFKAYLVDSDDEMELLTKRKKTATETVKEEEDYINWLKGNTKHLKEKNVEKDVTYLKTYWNKDKLDEDEQFLRDFILKKEHLPASGTNEIPSYHKIVREIAEDEEEFDKQETFENKYNFRFEEPDEEFIKRFPRLIPDSMRHKDDKRKEKREEIRERKTKEKDRKKQELNRLKAMKRMEIMEKLEKIKQITGNTKVGLKDIDLEEDFDPEKHDRQMQEMFGKDYYDEGGNEDEKPELLEDEEYENWDEWNGENTDNFQSQAYEPHCEDPDFNMDCDYNPKMAFQEEMINSSRKKRRKMSKLAKALKVKKPTFDPAERTFEEYFDEYYQLDYEDLIGDMPCRFKYRKVLANDFGLTVDEILGADDRELNKWCSLKKFCRYRSEQEENEDKRIYVKKANNFKKKASILQSYYVKDEEGTEQAEETDVKILPKNSKGKTEFKKDTNSKGKKRQRDDKQEGTKQNGAKKAKGKKQKEDGKGIKQNGEKKQNNKTDVNQEGKKWKGDGKETKRSHHKKLPDIDVGMPNKRMLAFGINPKRYKYSLKYSKKTD